MKITRMPAQSRKPRVICHDNPSNCHIVASLRQLHQNFTPTPWLFNQHAQLIFHSLRKNLSRQKRREAMLYDHHDALTMRDGGRTALHWSGHALPDTTPTIVVLHTITGSPASMAELMHDLRTVTGWRVVLCLRRGHADEQCAQRRKKSCLEHYLSWANSGCGSNIRHDRQKPQCLSRTIYRRKRDIAGPASRLAMCGTLGAP